MLVVFNVFYDVHTHQIPRRSAACSQLGCTVLHEQIRAHTSTLHLHGRRTTSESPSSVPVPALARDAGAPPARFAWRRRHSRAVAAARRPVAMLLVVLAGAPVRIEQGVRGSSTAARTIRSPAADRSGRRYVVRREARSARLCRAHTARLGTKTKAVAGFSCRTSR